MKQWLVLVTFILLSQLSLGQEAGAETDISDRPSELFSKVEFPGGGSKLLKFIAERLTVAPTDFTSGISTKVTVSFVVTKTGELEEVDIVKGISPAVDAKIVQIFEQMPAWRPAYENGKPIRKKVIYPLILEFDLE